MVTMKTLKLALVAIGVLFFAAIFIACRYMYGTYSLFEAAEIEKTLIALDKKYKAMLSKRETYRYHIGRAESGGTLCDLLA